MTMGERIRSLRVSRGWTQRQLADKVGKSEKAVSAWEIGMYYPRIGTLEKIAKAFEVTKGYIVDGDK